MIPTVSKMEIEHILILEFGDENDVLTRLEREFLDEEMTLRKPSKLKWRRIMIQHTFHEWSWCRHISHADEDGKGQRLGPREGKELRECYLTQTKFRTYFVFITQHIPVSQTMSTHPPVTRTTCRLTRTHDALTRAGRPLNILVPAGWVWV